MDVRDGTREQVRNPVNVCCARGHQQSLIQFIMSICFLKIVYNQLPHRKSSLLCENSIALITIQSIFCFMHLFMHSHVRMCLSCIYPLNSLVVNDVIRYTPFNRVSF